MAHVIIKIDTGFVNAIHELELSITPEEWDELSISTQYEIQAEAMGVVIETYAVSSEDEETAL